MTRSRVKEENVEVRTLLQDTTEVHTNTYYDVRHSFKIIYGQWALKINVVSSFEEVNFFYVAVQYALLILILCKDACKCFNYFF